MNIDQAQITLFTNKINRFLLLKNPAATTNHLLGMLGLFTIDFPDKESVRVSYDEDGISVMAKPFGSKCTCANEKDDLKLNLEHTGHGIRHTSTCDLYRREKILYHDLTREIDTTDPQVSLYDFDWPRDIQPYRASIATWFPEQSNDGLWKAFTKTWTDIMELLPKDDSLADNPEPDAKTGYEDIGDPELGSPQPDTSVDEDTDPACFGDTAQSVEDSMAETSKQEMVESDDDYDSDIPLPSATATFAIALEQPQERPTVSGVTGIPGYENVLAHGSPTPSPSSPPQPEVPVRKKRGRKHGSTDVAKAIREAEASEMKPEDFIPRPSPEGEGKFLPSCAFYAKMMREEFVRLSSAMDDIEAAEVVPVEDLKMVKESLDRMALRSAHMELRGVNDDGERRVNMLIETTVSNVLATMQAATRDLGLAPDDPRTWESFRKLLGDVGDKAKAMLELMTQPGAGPAIYSVGTTSRPSDE
jgi:hypothetical protein